MENRPAGGAASVLPEPPLRNPALSIVIPVYNEKENLAPLWDELRPVLIALDRPFEVLFVDDGSTDGSAEVLAGLRAAAPAQVRILRLAVNSGQTAALIAGWSAARGEIVATLDADRQNDPADLPALLERLPEFDAAVGFRANRADTWVRRASSRIANAIRNALSGDDIIDTGCTLKAIRRACLASVPPYAGMHRFVPTLLRMNGYRVVQVPVGHRPRVAGVSKYGIGNRALRAFNDLLAVRWMRRRLIRYRATEE